MRSLGMEIVFLISQIEIKSGMEFIFKSTGFQQFFYTTLYAKVLHALSKKRFLSNKEVASCVKTSRKRLTQTMMCLLMNFRKWQGTRHINSLMQVSHRSIILKLLFYTFFYYKQLHFGG